MKKLSILLVFACLLPLAASAQDQNAADKDIWFVWIDTETEIDGAPTRIVSKQPFKISCCLKSPKYRKLLKKAEKWIIKNVDKNYQGGPLNKIQDMELARSMIKQASEGASTGKNLIFVDFTEECN